MNILHFMTLFILLNIIWLLYYWKLDNSTEEFSPKFISSSYDQNLRIQFKSQVLQSLSPYLFTLFPSSLSIITSHTGDIPIGASTMYSQLKKEKEYNISYLHQSDIGKNKLNSEYEMFLDEEKKNIFILKLHINYNYSNDISIISMYSIPVDNFIISTREEYDLNKSCINKLWEMKIEGIIKKYSISQDKKYLGIIFNRIRQNNIDSIVKYIELFNINETSNNLNNSSNITEENNDNFTNVNNISNNISNYLYNKNEIYIKGNLPLTNIDVSKDIIILSRESKEFVDILLRNNSNNSWQEFDLSSFLRNSNYNNSTSNNDIITYFNNINSFKILNDDNDNLSLLELYISIKSKGIYAYSKMIDFDKHNYTSNINTLISYRLDKESEDENVKNISYIYDIKTSLSQLKEDYIHNSIFSKNNINNNKIINFEFFHRTMVSLNMDSLELNKIATLSSGINSIQSDTNNNNLIAIDAKKFIYYFYKRNDYDLYEDYKIINLNNIPNKYRTSEILTSYVETFENNKTRLLLLLNQGVIISLDLGKLIKKMNRNIIKVIIYDYFFHIFMAIFNLTTLIVALKKRRKKSPRNNDIANAIGMITNARRA